MATLQDISDRLLVRAQEATLQLDVWIQQQKRFCELSGLNTEDLCKNHALYISQLNSLYVRSKEIGDKLRSGENRSQFSFQDEGAYIEELVYEFRDITLKLNELASLRRVQGSPSSQTSQYTCSSFKPRPYKISARHNSSSLEIDDKLDFPTKGKSNIRGASLHYPPEISLKDPVGKTCGDSWKINQLPLERQSTPLKKNNTIICPAKKQNEVLLIHDSKPNANHSVYQRLFKNKNRISLSLTNTEIDVDSSDASCYDNDDNTLNYNSDDDQVISYERETAAAATAVKESPKFVSKAYTSLRRYNSHESLLSMKSAIKPTYQSPTKLPFFGATRKVTPTVGRVQGTCSPVFTITSLGGSVSAETSPQRRTTVHKTIKSRELLLFSLGDISQRGEKGNAYSKFKQQSSSFLDSFAKLILTSEVGHSEAAIQVSKRSVRRSKQPLSGNKLETLTVTNIDESKTLSHGRNMAVNCLDTGPSPIISDNIRYGDLQEALNTELLL